MIKNVTIIMKQTWFADDNTKITILTKNKKILGYFKDEVNGNKYYRIYCIKTKSVDHQT